MPTTMQTLGIDRMSPEERLRLIEEIWDSLCEPPTDLPLTEEQRADLQRRLDAYRENPKAGSPWEEVLARLRGR